MCNARTAAAAALIVVQSCASYAPPPPAATRPEFGVVAIAPARHLPESNFVAPVRHDANAAIGTALVNAPGLVNLGPALASPLAPFMVVVVASAALIGGTIASVDIALNSVPAEKAREIEAAIRESTAALDVQNAFAARLAKQLEDERLAEVREAHAAGVDTVLEAEVLQLRFAGCNVQGFNDRLLVRQDLIEDQCPGGPRNPSLYLSVQAKVRALRVADGMELASRAFAYRGARRTLDQWMSGDAALLRQELGTAFASLAEQATDTLFLVANVDVKMPPGFPALPGSDPAYGLCWLAPLYPAAEPLLVSEMWTAPFTQLSKRNLCPGSALHFSPIESLQPTLRWSALPPQAAAHPVTYDLKIWRAEDCVRVELVYRRSGLTQPEHRLEDKLVPAQRYFWSVRARFAAAGRPAASPWSFFTPGLS